MRISLCSRPTFARARVISTNYPQVAGSGFVSRARTSRFTTYPPRLPFSPALRVADGPNLRDRTALQPASSMERGHVHYRARRRRHSEGAGARGPRGTRVEVEKADAHPPLSLFLSLLLDTLPLRSREQGYSLGVASPGETKRKKKEEGERKKRKTKEEREETQRKN